MNYIGTKNILFILVAAVIIGGAFLFSKYRSDYTKNTLVSNDNIVPVLVPDLATSTVQPISYQGDWQKTLAIGAGTSSWLASADSEDSSYFAPGQTVTGATDLFGKKLFAQYIASKQAGDDTSATDTQQYIVSQVMGDGTVLPSPKTYDKSNISIIADNSNAAIKKYGNSIATIFNNHTIANTGNELTIVQTSLNKSDPTLLKGLDPIIANDQNMLQELLSVKTPSGLAHFHIDLINAVSSIIFIDQGFTEIYSNGIVSLQGLGLYEKSMSSVGTALQNIVQYFKIMGVTFDPNEPGAVFKI